MCIYLFYSNFLSKRDVISSRHPLFFSKTCPLTQSRCTFCSFFVLIFHFFSLFIFFIIFIVSTCGRLSHVTHFFFTFFILFLKKFHNRCSLSGPYHKLRTKSAQLTLPTLKLLFKSKNCIVIRSCQF